MLRADNPRLVGVAAVTPQEEAEAALARVQGMRPKRSTAHTLQQQAQRALKAADEVCQRATGAPVNSTLSLSSAAVRSSRDDYVLVNPTPGSDGVVPAMYECPQPLPRRSSKPCFHCGETFDGPPFMLRVPHPDKPKEYRMWGNFCGVPCMIAFTLERNNVQGVETAYAWETAREVYGVEGEVPVAAPSWAMRRLDGPFAPQRPHDVQKVVRHIRGARFVPEGAMFTCSSLQRGGGDSSASSNMALMFARNNYNPQGLQRPSPGSRPKIAARRVRPSMARQFCDAVKAGMAPEDIEVDMGLERRHDVSVRRGNIGTVEAKTSPSVEEAQAQAQAQAQAPGESPPTPPPPLAAVLAESPPATLPKRTKKKKKKKRKRHHDDHREEEEEEKQPTRRRRRQRHRSASSDGRRRHKRSKRRHRSPPPAAAAAAATLQFLVPPTAQKHIQLSMHSACSGGTQRGVHIQQMRKQAMAAAVAAAPPHGRRRRQRQGRRSHHRRTRL